MSCSRTLIFMDSGIGGIPYLRWVRQRRPEWTYIYLADHAFFPYGGKGTDILTDRLLLLSDRLIRLHQPDMIVLACNTASVTALPALRSRFELPFVGVVPAVKPASEVPEADRIGVLATKGTVEGPYLQRLIDQFSGSRSVDCIAAPDLVRFVETRLLHADESEIRNILMPYLSLAAEKNWRCMVLGCTHFIMLRPWLEKWKSPSLRIVDSTEGVGNRVLSLIGNGGLDAEPGQPEDFSRFYVTGEGETCSFYREFADREKLKYSCFEEEPR